VPRTPITPAEERRVAHFLNRAPNFRSPKRVESHLAYVSEAANVPLWKVKVLAKRAGINV